MKKYTTFTDPYDSDDMYVDDEVPKEPPGNGSSKSTGKATKGWDTDSAREDLRRKEERIQSLEQEVIKLQLENNLLTVTKPGIG